MTAINHATVPLDSLGSRIIPNNFLVLIWSHISIRCRPEYKFYNIVSEWSASVSTTALVLISNSKLWSLFAPSNPLRPWKHRPPANNSPCYYYYFFVISGTSTYVYSESSLSLWHNYSVGWFCRIRKSIRAILESQHVHCGGWLDRRRIMTNALIDNETINHKRYIHNWNRKHDEAAGDEAAGDEAAAETKLQEPKLQGTKRQRTLPEAYIYILVP